MTNIFLKVNKDLFKLGLNPTELLILAQVMEFNTNTGDCFMSDKAMSECFGVSESTISRAVKALETKGFVSRSTKNVRNGRERHIAANLENIEKALANVKMPVAESEPSVKMTVAENSKQLATVKMTVPQQSNCLLGNRQNDFIKDNIIKEKEKDNIDEIELLSASLQASSISLSEGPGEKEIQKPKLVSAKDAIQIYGSAAVLNAIPTKEPNCFWISGELVKVY